MNAELMIDVTGAALPALLAALGPNLPAKMAAYVTGSDGVDWPTQYLTQLAGRTGLFKYDQTVGLQLFGSGAADGADIERGAGTTGSLIDQARKREARGWYSWAYIDQADYPNLRGEVQAAGLKKVQYGIANWNDSLEQAVAQLGGEIVFVQWASPTSNPHTPVPGTTRTLAQLDCDLNETIPGWFSIPKPVHKFAAVAVLPTLATIPVTSPDLKTFTAK